MRILLALALSALPLGGCITPVPPTARFDSYVARSEAVDFAGYRGVFLAPIGDTAEATTFGDGLVFPGVMGNEARPLTRRELDEQKAALRRRLLSAIGEVAPLAGTPGPGILTVAVVLTDLAPNRPSFAELTATPGLDASSVYAGDASAQVTISDGATTLVQIEEENNEIGLDRPPALNKWDTANDFGRRLSASLAALLAPVGGTESDQAARISS